MGPLARAGVDGLSCASYRGDRNLAGDVMEPVIWTLDTYVGGLRFDQDLTLLEIKLGCGASRLLDQWYAGRLFLVFKSDIPN